jgi:hypothetical protein
LVYKQLISLLFSSVMSSEIFCINSDFTIHRHLLSNPWPPHPSPPFFVDQTIVPCLKSLYTLVSTHVQTVTMFVFLHFCHI